MPFTIIKALGCSLDLTAVELIDIDVQNFGPIQRDLNSLATDFDFLVVPFADRAQETWLRSDTMVQ